jgi:hypothetical protein
MTTKVALGWDVFMATAQLATGALFWHGDEWWANTSGGQYGFSVAPGNAILLGNLLSMYGGGGPHVVRLGTNVGTELSTWLTNNGHTLTSSGVLSYPTHTCFISASSGVNYTETLIRAFVEDGGLAILNCGTYNEGSYFGTLIGVSGLAFTGYYLTGNVYPYNISGLPGTQIFAGMGYWTSNGANEFVLSGSPASGSVHRFQGRVNDTGTPRYTLAIWLPQ